MSENESGWFEEQQDTTDGKKKAPEHVIAATKAQLQDVSKVPMVKQETLRTDTRIPDGWKKTDNGYHFRKEVAEMHTADTFTTFILHGDIKGNHGTLTLWIYSKNVGELKELQEKASILEAKLTSYSASDPEFVTVGNRLHNFLFKIKKIKKDLTPNASSKIKFEEDYHDTGYEGDRKARYQDWCREFMSKANKEAERVDAEINKREPINNQPYEYEKQ